MSWTSIVPLTEYAAGRLANHGKGLRQQIVQGFTRGYSLFELDRFGGKLRIIEFLESPLPDR